MSQLEKIIGRLIAPSAPSDSPHPQRWKDIRSCSSICQGTGCDFDFSGWAPTSVEPVASTSVARPGTAAATFVEVHSRSGIRSLGIQCASLYRYLFISLSSEATTRFSL